MKATELLDKLNKLIEKYGDEEVVFQPYYSFEYDYIDSVDIYFDIAERGDRKFIIK